MKKEQVKQSKKTIRSTEIFSRTYFGSAWRSKHSNTSAYLCSFILLALWIPQNNKNNKKKRKKENISNASEENMYEDDWGTKYVPLYRMKWINVILFYFIFRMESTSVVSARKRTMQQNSNVRNGIVQQYPRKSALKNEKEQRMFSELNGIE